MAGRLSPRGKADAQMKIRFIRYEEVPNYFEMEENLLYAYAKAAGAVYQLAKIRLIKMEILEEFMKHLTKVGRTAKLIQRKYVRVGEGSIVWKGFRRLCKRRWRKRRCDMCLYPKSAGWDGRERAGGKAAGFQAVE